MRPGERLNSISHLVGTALAVAALIALVVLTARSGSALKIAAFSIYGVSLVFLYLASTLYHSLAGRAKQIFKRLDHIGIFLLIAGTYTPFAIVMLGGPWGWALFGTVWALAAVGIVLEAVFGDRVSAVSSVLYLAIGWLAVLAVKPLVNTLDLGTLLWVGTGGVLYTAGFGLLAIKSLRVRHEIWHFFVLGGSACHFVAMFLYVR